MPEPKKAAPEQETVNTSAAPAQAQVSPQRVYRGLAGESGDPELHRLLAELQTAEMNGDRKAAAEFRRQIDELGYLL